MLDCVNACKWLYYIVAYQRIIMVLNQAQATRERPRTGSQNSGSSVPVSVAPPPGMVQHAAPQAAPQPAPQPKPPSVDLLGDLGGDPFAQPQPQGESSLTTIFLYLLSSDEKRSGYTVIINTLLSVTSISWNKLFPENSEKLSSVIILSYCTIATKTTGEKLLLVATCYKNHR